MKSPNSFRIGIVFFYLSLYKWKKIKSESVSIIVWHLVPKKLLYLWIWLLQEKEEKSRRTRKRNFTKVILLLFYD